MLLLFEVEALEEQLNEQEEEAQKAEASLAKHKSGLAIEQRKNAELEAIVQSTAEELSDAQCRIEELITQAAGLEELEKDNERLRNSELELRNSNECELTHHQNVVTALKHKEATALSQCQELTQKVEDAEQAEKEMRLKMNAMEEEHKPREVDYNVRVEAMKQHMGVFEETIQALQAESFNGHMDGSIQGDIKEELGRIETLVEAASEKVRNIQTNCTS